MSACAQLEEGCAQTWRDGAADPGGDGCDEPLTRVDTGCRLLDTGQVDPDRVDCHFPRHNNLEIDIVSGTAPLGSGFFNRPFLPPCTLPISYSTLPWPTAVRAGRFHLDAPFFAGHGCDQVAAVDTPAGVPWWLLVSRHSPYPPLTTAMSTSPRCNYPMPPVQYSEDSVTVYGLFNHNGFEPGVDPGNEVVHPFLVKSLFIHFLDPAAPGLSSMFWPGTSARMA